MIEKQHKLMGLPKCLLSAPEMVVYFYIHGFYGLYRMKNNGIMEINERGRMEGRGSRSFELGI